MAVEIADLSVQCCRARDQRRKERGDGERWEQWAVDTQSRWQTIILALIEYVRPSQSALRFKLWVLFYVFFLRGRLWPAAVRIDYVGACACHSCNRCPYAKPHKRSKFNSRCSVEIGRSKVKVIVIIIVIIILLYSLPYFRFLFKRRTFPETSANIFESS